MFFQVLSHYYFNARYYDATIGRFINVDPIQDGTNWYVYCYNNPLSFKDPTGLLGQPEQVGDTPALMPNSPEYSDYFNRLIETWTLRNDSNDRMKEPIVLGIPFDWEYGYYGGGQYAGGVHNDENVSAATFSQPSLNSVDEAFKQHDYAGFKLNFPYLYSSEALPSHYQLVETLKNIIDSEVIIDTKSGKALPTDSYFYRDAMNAAKQAYTAFNDFVIPRAVQGNYIHQAG